MEVNKIKKIIMMFTMVAFLTLLPFAVPTSAVINEQPNEQQIQQPSSFSYIVINPDGSVTGNSPHVHRLYHVPFTETYGFIGNIHAEIYVQRSGVTIDGDGWTLNATAFDFGSGWWDNLEYGFTLNSVDDVTIKNVQVVNFLWAFTLVNTIDITIEENVVFTILGTLVLNSTYTNVYKNSFSNWFGIFNLNSNHSTYAVNSITCYGGFELVGIVFENSHFNTIRENYIQHWRFLGLGIAPDSNNNKVYQNTFFNNSKGLSVTGRDNRIYRNDFQNNTIHCSAGESQNYWNKNYWDTYNGTDSDGDKIGDTPYVIGENNIDYQPLMIPFEDYLNYPQKTGGLGWQRNLMR
ncbi:right-handed parallel beta-helix repeat-containing protein [Candidatus Bathyarchaeota archaeon]|nr:right-handed parallel beta-helix repeat-containing protein [Candidatus Bathyarchaeota archaeon]